MVTSSQHNILQEVTFLNIKDNMYTPPPIQKPNQFLLEFMELEQEYNFKQWVVKVSSQYGHNTDRDVFYIVMDEMLAPPSYYMITGYDEDRSNREEELYLELRPFSVKVQNGVQVGIQLNKKVVMVLPRRGLELITFAKYKSECKARTNAMNAPETNYGTSKKTKLSSVYGLDQKSYNNKLKAKYNAFKRR